MKHWYNFIERVKKYKSRRCYFKIDKEFMKDVETK